MDNISLEFTELQKFKRPTLNDSENMINVDMNSYGVTSASSENPMLKTLGLGHWVGVVLYEPTKKLAGLFHLTTPLDVSARGIPLWQMIQEDIVGLLTAMQRNGLTVDDKKTIIASLISWRGSEDLTRLMPIVVDRLKQLGVSRIALGEEGRNSIKHIAIDARDGKIYNLKKLLPRKRDDFDKLVMQMCGEMPYVTSDKRSLR